jgi:hypothetical protein
MVRIVLFALALAALPAAAQEPKREYIYGGELMTGKERDRYRAEMGAAKDEEKQKRVRAQHRERMQKRARERGVTLDEQGVVKKK